MAITNKMYENKQLKLNVNLRGHKAGTTVPIKTDKQGTPLDPYWRNRLKDSATDNCVEMVSSPKKKPLEIKREDKL